MSIEEGQRYRITNAKSGTALDLSSDDEYTIAGWDWHGGDNQIVRSYLTYALGASVTCPACLVGNLYRRRSVAFQERRDWQVSCP